MLPDGVWNNVLSFDNVDDSVECFTTVLQGLLDALLPLHRIRIKQHTNPWAATSSVLAARRHRDKLYRRALLSGTPTDWQLFRHARNRVNHLLRSAKSQYLTDLCESSKGSSKQFWSLFRCLSTKSTKSSYNNDAFTADDINDYFLSVPFNTVQSVPSTSLSPLSYLLDRSEANFQMFTVDVDVDEVVSILTSLDSARATGCDELSVRFIKACPLAMARLLTRVINQSISSCTFPSPWKCAVVTPVQKSKNISAQFFQFFRRS